MDNAIENSRAHKDEHTAFEIGMFIKLAFAIFETIGGIVIFFVKPSTWNGLILKITQHELVTDPKDLVANYLRHFGATLTIHGEHFTGIFLISHGLIKIALVYGLLRKIMWTYPVAIVVFSGFIVYQMYDFSIGHSPYLLFLSILDLVIVILTAIEYNNLKKTTKGKA